MNQIALLLEPLLIISISVVCLIDYKEGILVIAMRTVQYVPLGFHIPFALRPWKPQCIPGANSNTLARSLSLPLPLSLSITYVTYVKIPVSVCE